MENTHEIDVPFFETNLNTLSKHKEDGEKRKLEAQQREIHIEIKEDHHSDGEEEEIIVGKPKHQHTQDKGDNNIGHEDHQPKKVHELQNHPWVHLDPKNQETQVIPQGDFKHEGECDDKNMIGTNNI